MSDVYQFRLIFNKAKSNNPVIQFGYNRAYEGVVNYAFELFGLDAKGLDQSRWDDPNGQAITWTGTYEECLANQQKLKKMRPKVINDFRIKAQSWLNSWWFPLRKQRAAINNKLEEFSRTEDQDGAVWKALQSSLMLFGVIMIDDIMLLEFESPKQVNVDNGIDVKKPLPTDLHPNVNDNTRTTEGNKDVDLNVPVLQSLPCTSVDTKTETHINK